MFGCVRVAAVALAVAAGFAAAMSSPALAGSSSSLSSFMRVYARSEPPSGFVAFCNRSPDDCRSMNDSSDRVILTDERWHDLIEVNQVVNRTVKPVSDFDLYGITEYWTLPQASGDCEDYVLLKQRLLTERGWPQGSVLITVVRDEAGQGHAVMTARTSRGDFILDNRYEAVKLWHQTGYDFVKRQSYIKPTIWMSLAPANRLAQPPVASGAPEY
ncbi:MAG: transglutaminase-like cysteine peptidase [Hyphomicrobiaceae bacterium]